MFSENESELACIRIVFLALIIQLIDRRDTRKDLIISSGIFPFSMEMVSSFCLSFNRVRFDFPTGIVDKEKLRNPCSRLSVSESMAMKIYQLAVGRWHILR